MLRHIVMWTFREQAEGADRATNVARARALLEGCAGITPGIVHFTVATATPGMDCTADLVLDSTFTDAHALAAYQAHTTHAAIKPFMKAAVASSRSDALRELSSTRAPASPRAWAICRPRPREPPVMRAVRPWRSKSCLIVRVMGLSPGESCARASARQMRKSMQ